MMMVILFPKLTLQKINSQSLKDCSTHFRYYVDYLQPFLNKLFLIAMEQYNSASHYIIYLFIYFEGIALPNETNVDLMTLISNR